jgi:hypothetical protein
MLRINLLNSEHRGLNSVNRGIGSLSFVTNLFQKRTWAVVKVHCSNTPNSWMSAAKVQRVIRYKEN